MAQESSTYLHDIPSIGDLHPGFPAIIASNLDLNRRVQLGDSIDLQNLTDEKAVAQALRSIHECGLNDQVTQAVGQSAESRVIAVEVAHGFASYIPGPLGLMQAVANLNDHITAKYAQQFLHLDARVDQLDSRLNEIDANYSAMREELAICMALARNNGLLAHNRYHTVPRPYVPLYKTVPGDGLSLAANIFPQGLAHIIIPPAQDPVVGTVPPNFNNNYLAYQYTDIISLITFYNEDFGIVAGDTVSDCVTKFFDNILKVHEHNTSTMYSMVTE